MGDAPSAWSLRLGSHEADARARIRNWLGRNGPYLGCGPARGGIAGQVGADGQAVFLYGEVAGYWLQWAASYAPDPGRMGSVVAFIGQQWEGPQAAPTRLGADGDWRNRAVFSFDLAMMLRGVAAAAPVVGAARACEVASVLVHWLERLVDAEGCLMSHIAMQPGPLPRRWSTCDGPYQTKTAAAVLSAPADWLSARVSASARRTLARWMGRAADHEPLHARCYALEGECIAGGRIDATPLLAHRLSDGMLAEHAGCEAGLPRSDIQAQALRLLCLQADSGWAGIETMSRALLRHVRDDGSVVFRVGEAHANVWCALFAHQALDWLCARRGCPAAQMPSAEALV
jgi:hypothetical protein